MEYACRFTNPVSAEGPWKRQNKVCFFNLLLLIFVGGGFVCVLPLRRKSSNKSVIDTELLCLMWAKDHHGQLSSSPSVCKSGLHLQWNLCRPLMETQHACLHTSHKLWRRHPEGETFLNQWHSYQKCDLLNWFTWKCERWLFTWHMPSPAEEPRTHFHISRTQTVTAFWSLADCHQWQHLPTFQTSRTETERTAKNQSEVAKVPRFCTLI